METLKDVGLDSFFLSSFKQVKQTKKQKEMLLARVLQRVHYGYDLFTNEGIKQGRLIGNLYKAKQANTPVVGDFVYGYIDPHSKFFIIQGLLERKTFLSRKIKGKAQKEQVLIANVDTIFIVTSANDEFNVKRIERYLSIVNEGKATPVFLLTKIDLNPDYLSFVDLLKKQFKGIDIIALASPVDNVQEKLSSYLLKATTCALIGSSGVGKSTIINALFQKSLQDTNTVQYFHQKGRHTTTVRKLFFLENGAMIIDNPGMREIQLWIKGDSIEESFTDILNLAKDCKFRDCKHDKEPDCAVQKAILEGKLSQEKLDNFHKLIGERDDFLRKQLYNKKK